MLLPRRLVWMLSGVLAALPVWAVGPLNDTGIDFCGAATGGNASCTGALPAGQDARYGRDAAAAAGKLPKKVGAGDKGFDFTKIANNGAVLPATATLGKGVNNWACTRDNVTGLIWEVKTDDGGLRDKDWTYHWYDPKMPNGYTGSEGDTSTCNKTLGQKLCNTQNYVTAIRSAKLCGASDWRMPTRKELEGIVDYGRTSLAIDPVYFPYTPSSNVWSGSPYAGNLSYAWVVNFGNGGTNTPVHATGSHVRLVRGGK